MLSPVISAFPETIYEIYILGQKRRSCFLKKKKKEGKKLEEVKKVGKVGLLTSLTRQTWMRSRHICSAFTHLLVEIT